MPLNRSHETIVLDLFIASKVHDDVQAAEGRLSQQEAFRDLFNLMQLRARLEDLLCAHVAPLRLDLAGVHHHVSSEACPGCWPLASDDR